MINITFHHARASADDELRARRAAEAVFEARGVSPEAAYEAFLADCEASGRATSELGKIWADAGAAAHEAGTEGWLNARDVFVEIMI